MAWSLHFALPCAGGGDTALEPDGEGDAGAAQPVSAGGGALAQRAAHRRQAHPRHRPAQSYVALTKHSCSEMFETID